MAQDGSICVRGSVRVRDARDQPCRSARSGTSTSSNVPSMGLVTCTASLEADAASGGANQVVVTWLNQ